MHCLLLCEFHLAVLSPVKQTLILIMLLRRQRAAEAQKQHANFGFNTCRTCVFMAGMLKFPPVRY